VLNAELNGAIYI